MIFAKIQNFWIYPEIWDQGKLCRINYIDLECEVMVRDIGAPVSLAGTKWLEQYLEEFDLTIEEMESSPCHQVF